MWHVDNYGNNPRIKKAEFEILFIKVRSKLTSLCITTQIHTEHFKKYINFNCQFCGSTLDSIYD